jgi:hypothetical protein
MALFFFQNYLYRPGNLFGYLHGLLLSLLGSAVSLATSRDTKY